jgi:hypothetical protein
VSLEVHHSVENAMYDLDFYILVGTRNGYPVTEMTASDYSWARSARDVRCYRSIATAKGIRTKALRNVRRANASDSGYRVVNKGIEDIRILHVRVNLVSGTTESEWVE